MSRYKKSSPVPLIAGGVLLVAFVVIVVALSGGKEEQETAFRPAAEPVPVPVPVPLPPPVVDEGAPEALEAPVRTALSPAEAERSLRSATAEWRAFTVDLCQTQKWPTPRAVAFLEKVTWNDRDKEKQHENGLESIRRMLGAETNDPVALARALRKEGSLDAFFKMNWSKVDVAWEPPKEKEVVLEDAWKPNRIRWGFPLDTPVIELQQFQQLSRAAVQTWQGLSRAYIQTLELDDASKQAKWLAAVGQGVQLQEAKMRAAFGLMFGAPKGSVKEVVEAFVQQTQGQSPEEVGRLLGEKLPAAVEAAEKAE